MSDEPQVGELLGVIDRLEALLEASELSEIEVEAGGTTLILRKPEAFAAVAAAGAAGAGGSVGQPQGGSPGGGAGVGGQAAGSAGASGQDTPAAHGYHAVVAPLTGVFYNSPSPGAAVYVREGGSVSTGQVIGLIEAMKLFNEIKSDVTGTVRRIAAETGALVKAKQTLIEVEPS
jgi:acetyl-CoA carboxylase biotin carboxyl carrier protein